MTEDVDFTIFENPEMLGKKDFDPKTATEEATKEQPADILFERELDKYRHYFFEEDGTVKDKPGPDLKAKKVNDAGDSVYTIGKELLGKGQSGFDNTTRINKILEQYGVAVQIGAKEKEKVATKEPVVEEPVVEISAERLHLLKKIKMMSAATGMEYTDEELDMMSTAELDELHTELGSDVGEKINNKAEMMMMGLMMYGHGLESSKDIIGIDFKGISAYYANNKDDIVPLLQEFIEDNPTVARMLNSKTRMIIYLLVTPAVIAFTNEAKKLQSGPVLGQE